VRHAIGERKDLVRIIGSILAFVAFAVALYLGLTAGRGH
jgi:preprotein translocase subunit SecE